MHFGSRHFIIKSITSRIPLGLSVILRTVSAINTSLHEGYPWLAWTHTVNIQTGQKYLGNNFPAEDRTSAMPDTCWIACFLFPFHLATTQLRHAFYVISECSFRITPCHGLCHGFLLVTISPLSVLPSLPPANVCSPHLQINHGLASASTPTTVT